MTSSRIRRARADEAGRLSEIARRAKAAWGYPPEWLCAWQSELTITAEYIGEHHVLVAEGPTGVDAVAALEVAGTEAKLEHLWVDPVHEGGGIGRALVQQVLGLAAELECHQVSVVSDPNAEAFYKRLSAERAGSLPAPMPGAPSRSLPVLRFVLRRSASGQSQGDSVV